MMNERGGDWRGCGKRAARSTVCPSASSAGDDEVESCTATQLTGRVACVLNTAQPLYLFHAHEHTKITSDAAR